MDWTREHCLRLINEFKNHPELWDPEDESYNRHKRRIKTWATLDRVIGCEDGGAKKKMASLLASFRRERAKSKKFIGEGEGKRQVYVSTWFGFRPLGFLLNKREKIMLDQSPYQPFEVNETENVTICKEETSYLDESEYDGMPVFNYFDEIEVDSNETQTIVTVNNASTSITKAPADTNNKRNSRKRKACDGEADNSSYDRLAQSSRKQSQQQTKQQHERPVELADLLTILQQSRECSNDECGVFAQHLANKLRSYNKKTRNIVEHRINNILFEADMGTYEASSSSKAQAETTHTAGESSATLEQQPSSEE